MVQTCFLYFQHPKHTLNMVLKAEQERVHALLKDTITLLCKNGLSFKSEFSVEALIGITLDKNDVFLININEIIRSEVSQKVTEYDRQGDLLSEEEHDLSSGANSDGEVPRRKPRKRRHKHIKTEAASCEEDVSDGNNGHCDELQQRMPENQGHHNKGSSQKEGKLDEKKSLKGDKDDEQVQDIIIIKEETNEDWSQFGDMSTFPSGSGAEISESTPHEQSFMSPSSSSFIPSQPGSFDWSQGTAINQNQFVPGTGSSSSDPNQQVGLPCICHLNFRTQYLV